MRLALQPGWTATAIAAAGAALAYLIVGGVAPDVRPVIDTYGGNAALLWTHVVSDALIGAAYISIPLTLLRLVRRRASMQFSWMVVLFALFIVCCGIVHGMSVWTTWHADYRLSGAVKVVTALLSVLTAVALVRLLPRILAIPTVAQVTAAKEALEMEVAYRALAEEALRRERGELERRVLERTEALACATQAAKAAHAAAEEANKLKDRFLAKVSHELRTPLQSTLSWAQVLQQSVDLPHQAAQAAERITQNVRTQARLIDDLLDISRILSGKLSLELHDVDACQVVHRAVDVVRAGATARGVTIEVVGAGQPVPMHTDPVRLEQVVWNLVSNAVQASPDGGRVSVHCHGNGASVWIEVQDWGRGIDAADLPHIFEPFRQVTAAGNPHRGLGLGLAITRSIVELFGGELHAYSEGLGQGATFTLQLPMVPGVNEDPAAAADLSDAERRRLQGLRVLYVEDEPDIAEAGRLVLSALGIDVRIRHRFEEALAQVRAGGFDVLLSDLNLDQGHSALELLAVLRQQPGGAQVPALVLSAYGSVEDRQATRRAGFARHLVKPADAGEVARALLAVSSAVHLQ